MKISKECICLFRHIRILENTIIFLRTHLHKEAELLLMVCLRPAYLTQQQIKTRGLIPCFASPEIFPHLSICFTRTGHSTSARGGRQDLELPVPGHAAANTVQTRCGCFLSGRYGLALQDGEGRQEQEAEGTWHWQTASSLSQLLPSWSHADDGPQAGEATRHPAASSKKGSFLHR